jgi:hypothetical protein
MQQGHGCNLQALLWDARMRCTVCMLNAKFLAWVIRDVVQRRELRKTNTYILATRVAERLCVLLQRKALVQTCRQHLLLCVVC